jgi:hypothetical protein
MPNKLQSPRNLTLSDSQFRELEGLFQSYLRVSALAAIREISENELWRNAWLLNVAGYDQFESAKILQTSQPTISRILSGKYTKKKGEL